MRLKNTRDLGLLLQARRKRVGWSQARLAHRLGITRQLVIALEKGTPGVAVGTVLKAFNALGLTLNANPRELSGDHDPVTRTSAIDDVIRNARSEAGNDLSKSRQPLPLSGHARKTRGES